MSHVRPKLSLAEKVGLASLLPFIIVKSIVQFLIRSIQIGDFTSRTRRRVLLTAVARNFNSLSLRQSRTILPPTHQAIARFCSRKNLPYTSILLPVSPDSPFLPGTLHLIRTSTEWERASEMSKETVLLYFHGGGYISPASSSHLKLSLCFAHAAKATTIAFLEYTLAPDLLYPGQLAQASSALSYLLREHPASKIIVGGDSAGGNLALGLLAHLEAPHPLIAPVQFPASDGDRLAPLKGAFCISPRCANDCSSKSWTTNGEKGVNRDIMSEKVMMKLTGAWRPVNGEVWGTPVCAEKGFWSGVLANVVMNVLLLVGGDEVYLDDVTNLAEMMGEGEKSGRKTLELEVCEGEAHAQCAMDVGLGIEDGIMLGKTLAWLQSI